MTHDEGMRARLTDEAIVRCALEAGFMLSTAYGQRAEQFMPMSDTATLRAFAEKIAALVSQHCEAGEWAGCDVPDCEGTVIARLCIEHAPTAASEPAREAAGESAAPRRYWGEHEAPFRCTFCGKLREDHTSTAPSLLCVAPAPPAESAPDLSPAEGKVRKVAESALSDVLKGFGRVAQALRDERLAEPAPAAPQATAEVDMDRMGRAILNALAARSRGEQAQCAERIDAAVAAERAKYDKALAALMDERDFLHSAIRTYRSCDDVSRALDEWERARAAQVGKG